MSKKKLVARKPLAFSFRSFADSLAWNLLLLTVGSLVFVVGYNGIAVYHGFIPGGVYGLSAVAHTGLPFFPHSLWYFLFNLPLFLFAWKGVSRRFFLLTLYCMTLTTVLTRTLHVDFGIQSEVYAAIAAGAVMGAGAGIILRSYGGGGGLDAVAIILNRKFGVRIGGFYFFINAAVMAVALGLYTPDKIVASLLLMFVGSVVTEYMLSLFSQRKAVRIVTKNTTQLVKAMTAKRHHATIFPGKGGYSGEEISMIFSITDNIRLRSLEQLVFETDPEAIFVVENTFNVLGGSIARRKVY